MKIAAVVLTFLSTSVQARRQAAVCQAEGEQCGGQAYDGVACCVDGTTCVEESNALSKCVATTDSVGMARKLQTGISINGVILAGPVGVSFGIWCGLQATVWGPCRLT